MAMLYTIYTVNAMLIVLDLSLVLVLYKLTEAF